jgi:uncharacterized protein YndB with AHSA1/START domain
MSQSCVTGREAAREVVTTHVFDAAPAVVFGAYTDPTLIPFWWGASHLTTIVEYMDVRPGGAWRFVQCDADGNEFAFHGVYQEVVPHERLVSTVTCDETPGHTILETITFEEVNGRTKLTTRSHFPPPLDDDRIIQRDSNDDAETMNRLGDLLDVL